MIHKPKKLYVIQLGKHLTDILGLADFLEIPHSTVRGWLSKYPHTRNEVIWGALWRKERGLSSRALIFHKNGKVVTPSWVSEDTGITYKTASSRCKQWVKGAITYEDLWQEKQCGRDPQGENPEERWKGLVRTPRRLVEDIKGPGTIEHQLWYNR